MAKGFKHGAGGGSSLNFKVVGGTVAPSNPKENTIWVNTDVPITGWYFSATQPENMAEGEVWFSTGASSSLEFNALKKNGIQVYPLSAVQYVGGALVCITTKIYQGVEWIYLYNREERIAELNKTGYARYSEGVAGEYVRLLDRGYTRNSILPVIWCWLNAGGFAGYCMIAATSGALAHASDNGGVATATCVTKAGNIAHIAYMGSAWAHVELNDNDAHINIYSNGYTYTLNRSYMNVCYNKVTLSDELSAWVDELLFGMR